MKGQLLKGHKEPLAPSPELHYQRFALDNGIP